MRRQAYDQELLVERLRRFVGPGWCDREARRPPTNRHVVFRWLSDYDRMRSQPPAGARREPTGGMSFEATGDIQCLLCLARDLVRAHTVSQPPKALHRRLRERSTFQAARHELAVASVMAGAGYKLEWQESKTERHVEFIAEDAAGSTVAVEAKSRRRAGVLDAVDGAPNDAEELGFLHLLRDALRQAPPELPLVVFLDANLPIRRRDYVRQGNWRLELQATVEKLERDGTAERPHEFSLLVMTNLAWYYDGGDETSGTASQWCWPKHSRRPLPDAQVRRILEAVDAYSVVPGGRWIAL